MSPHGVNMWHNRPAHMHGHINNSQCHFKSVEGLLNRSTGVLGSPLSQFGAVL